MINESHVPNTAYTSCYISYDSISTNSITILRAIANTEEVKTII